MFRQVMLFSLLLLLVIILLAIEATEWAVLVAFAMAGLGLVIVTKE